VKTLDLPFRSQVWRGLPWDHTLRVYVPARLDYPETMLLFITGESPAAADGSLGAALAGRLRAPTAILFNVPNQPLFDDKWEDELIAHTFVQYLESGDETWPLLFPMVQSAVAAMDLLQRRAEQEWGAPATGFVVAGASKRGWTSWLTAASDRRVKGVAPLVFDNLNFAAQMARQLELWGGYSDQIHDYTEQGLQQQMDTERGRRLVSLVDPWFRRADLALPKLLVNGANDRYWSTDATRLYWEDLPGERRLLTVPNAGHGLEDRERVLDTMAAFFHAVAAGVTLPEVSDAWERQGDELAVRAHSSTPAREVRLWTARAPNLDFRPVRWQSVPLPADGAGYHGRVAAPSSGGLAAFVEAEYDAPDGRFSLSTPTTVYGERPSE